MNSAINMAATESMRYVSHQRQMEKKTKLKEEEWKTKTMMPMEHFAEIL